MSKSLISHRHYASDDKIFGTALLFCMKSILLPSYAKINLGLQVFGKRDDGYHEIRSILQQIDLKDEIEIKLHKEPHIHFSCDSPTIPADSTNLCVRAAYLIQQYTKKGRGAKITLTKRIPAGAGLGGGSSNGAVVLLGLNQLWDAKLSSLELQELASKLGVDVPFFIRGGACLATGKGDSLEKVRLPDKFSVLIVFPQITISTKWAYDQVNLDLTMNKKNITFETFKDINFNNVDFFKIFKNEFEDIVFLEYPVLAEIKKQLYEVNALYASMSGTGSALYGLFCDDREAFSAQQKFQDRHQTFVTNYINWGYEHLNQHALHQGL